MAFEYDTYAGHIGGVVNSVLCFLVSLACLVSYLKRKFNSFLTRVSSGGTWLHYWGAGTGGVNLLGNPFTNHCADVTSYHSLSG